MGVVLPPHPTDKEPGSWLKASRGADEGREEQGEWEAVAKKIIKLFHPC